MTQKMALWDSGLKPISKQVHRYPEQHKILDPTIVGDAPENNKDHFHGKCHKTLFSEEALMYFVCLHSIPWKDITLFQALFLSSKDRVQYCTATPGNSELTGKIRYLAVLSTISCLVRGRSERDPKDY